jgi:hypothetical protein
MTHCAVDTLPLSSCLASGMVQSMKTQRLTVSDLKAMKTQCETHSDVELRVIVFCPACRGQVGGEHAATSMTAEEKKKRARKAARARWKKAKATKKT